MAQTLISNAAFVSEFKQVGKQFGEFMPSKAIGHLKFARRSISEIPLLSPHDKIDMMSSLQRAKAKIEHSDLRLERFSMIRKELLSTLTRSVHQPAPLARISYSLDPNGSVVQLMQVVANTPDNVTLSLYAFLMSENIDKVLESYSIPKTARERLRILSANLIIRENPTIKIFEELSSYIQRTEKALSESLALRLNQAGCLLLSIAENLESRLIIAGDN